MIKQLKDINSYKQNFSETKRIIIPEIFEPEFANSIYSGFCQLSENDLWYQANMGNPRKHDKTVAGINGPESMKSHFAYKFDKYPLKNITLNDLLTSDSRRAEINNIENENPEFELDNEHPLRKISDEINSKHFFELISNITGFEVSKSISFATRFCSGDFLGLSPGNIFKGKLGFFLNFTPDWLVHWGGSLAIFEENCEQITEAYIPRFNCLYLFELPLLHSILPVSFYTQEPRYEIAGYFI
jgi:hypothetical protein